MFIEPIEIATTALTPAPRSRPAALKLAVGVIFLALCALLMLPWTLLFAAWFAAAAAWRTVARIRRNTRALLIFSGETVLGR
jgi:uncharacterized membrane protein